MAACPITGRSRGSPLPYTSVSRVGPSPRRRSNATILRSFESITIEILVLTTPSLCATLAHDARATPPSALHAANCPLSTEPCRNLGKGGRALCSLFCTRAKSNSFVFKRACSSELASTPPTRLFPASCALLPLCENCNPNVSNGFRALRSLFGPRAKTNSCVFMRMHALLWKGGSAREIPVAIFTVNFIDCQQSVRIGEDYAKQACSRDVPFGSPRSSHGKVDAANGHL